ncbi:MAG: hypothetical protein HY904_05385 [Deltaproteobacteria bacterium]|nr:hypothetical protein [Deltaproteobacteria bacterium]
MSTVLAAQLLKSHQVRISRALARQIQQMVPRYREVDAGLLEKNILTLMDGMHALLERGDDRKLMGVVEYVVQIRSIGGFQTGEFMLACLCFLPVMRRFLADKLPMAQAVAAYEAVENAALPLVARLIPLYEKAATAFHQTETPPEVDIAALRGSGSTLAFRVESVTGGDEEETTEIDLRTPAARRA